MAFAADVKFIYNRYKTTTNSTSRVSSASVFKEVILRKRNSLTLNS